MDSIETGDIVIARARGLLTLTDGGRRPVAPLPARNRACAPLPPLTPIPFAPGFILDAANNLFKPDGRCGGALKPIETDRVSLPCGLPGEPPHKDTRLTLPKDLQPNPDGKPHAGTQTVTVAEIVLGCTAVTAPSAWPPDARFQVDFDRSTEAAEMITRRKGKDGREQCHLHPASRW